MSVIEDPPMKLGSNVHSMKLTTVCRGSARGLFGLRSLSYNKSITFPINRFVSLSSPISV